VTALAVDDRHLLDQVRRGQRPTGDELAALDGRERETADTGQARQSVELLLEHDVLEQPNVRGDGLQLRDPDFADLCANRFDAGAVGNEQRHSGDHAGYDDPEGSRRKHQAPADAVRLWRGFGHDAVSADGLPLFPIHGAGFHR
jgi:uncharacterized protein (DUF4415 family)